MSGRNKFDRPTKLSQLTLRNGYCLAPLSTRTALFDGEVSRNDCYFHQLHAQNVGLDIVGSAYVQQSGSTTSGSLSVADDSKLPGLRQLAQTIQKQGSKAILQLVHAGCMTNKIATNSLPILAPSAVAAPHGSGELPEAVTTSQITEIVDSFGAATQRAILAGFDGVEIHGANSFLLQQFMSPLTNQRTDEFGGSLANRVRFPLMVAQRVLQVAKQARRPFVVGYRISPEEIATGGLPLLDNLVLMRLLAGFKIDYLSLSLHDYQQQPVTMAKSQTVSEVIKAEIGDLPLMVAGGIKTLADVERLATTADVLAIGRQLMVDPKWPNRYRNPARLTTAKQLTAWDTGLPQQLFKYL